MAIGHILIYRFDNPHDGPLKRLSRAAGCNDKHHGDHTHKWLANKLKK